MTDFGLQTLLGLVKLLLLIFLIIMPLMILLELFRYLGLLERITRFTAPITERLGFKADSVFPLLAGIVFGISYGAGVLIGESKKERIVGRQAFLVAFFLALCHAIFEDTILFIAYGAVWWIATVARLTIAAAVTGIVALTLRKLRHE